MTWFAIRTKPGAQVPQREYVVETTNSAKGYRIVPSLDVKVSAVEDQLNKAGISHYMPAEKRLVRDRRHTDLFKTRRFALLVGYVFIKGPVDFEKVRKLPGVHDFVSICGEPMQIDLMDILALRSIEAGMESEFDKKSILARKAMIKKARNDPRLRKLANKLKLAEDLTLPISTGIAA